MVRKNKTFVFLLTALFIISTVTFQPTAVKAEAINNTNSPPSTAWIKTYGPIYIPYGSLSKVYSLISTSDGGYALAGEVETHIFVLKTDRDGNMQWNRSYGYGAASSIIQTSDGGYILACDKGNGYDDFGHMTYGDIPYSKGGSVILMKVDSAGNMVWNRTVIQNPSGQEIYGVYSMTKTSDGGFMLAGEKMTSAIEVGLNYDFLLIKVDDQANLQWIKTFGGAGQDEAGSVIQTSDGGFAAAGWSTSFGDNSKNFWLVKTDSNGNLQWDMAYSGKRDSVAYSVIQTDDGGYALVGDTVVGEPNVYDVLLVKTNQEGKTQWMQTYGQPGYNYGYSLVQTSDGGYAVAGSASNNPINNERIVQLIKTDSSGSKEWSYIYPEEYKDIEAYRVAATTDGSLAVAACDNMGGYNSTYYLFKFAPFLPVSSSNHNPLPSSSSANPNPNSQPGFQPITINGDGSVTPSSAPITKMGDIYKFTSNYYGSLYVCRSDIIIDGAGNTLQGNGTLAQNDGNTMYVRISQAAITVKDSANHVKIENFRINGYVWSIYFNCSSRNDVAMQNTIIGNGLAINEGLANGIFAPYTLTDSTISGNMFQASAAIYLRNSESNTVKDNIINASGSIYIYGGGNNTISNNTVKDSGGMQFYGSSNDHVFSNDLTNSGGINNAKDSNIYQNTLVNNSYGISQATNCIIYRNTIVNCSYGFQNCQGCTIYLNNLIDNNPQAGTEQDEISGSGWVVGHTTVPMDHNTWDNGIYGNYWSDYAQKYPSAKLGQHGTYATSYRIDENNVDNHPLQNQASTLQKISPTSLGQLWVVVATLVILLAVGAILVVGQLVRQRQRLKK